MTGSKASEILACPSLASLASVSIIFLPFNRLTQILNQIKALIQPEAVDFDFFLKTTSRIRLNHRIHSTPPTIPQV